ncbi:hypothetical protein F9K97_03385 [Brucella anthropi]|uniref:hypothetical protein n=1 Tax=Brucella anthropi TaxID=529 RepID=UPI00124EECFD|nr:hypothetical protein [Brucella anthropi]KAB2788160.1 hypothetical protein F9K97_03385 [Brucella anthropi]
MTPWTWFAGNLDDVVYDLAEEDTREKAIEVASRQLSFGQQFRIIEARSSSAQKYEGSDFIPFLRTRNAEIITVEGLK